jgi:hypothetical protein
MKHVLTIEQRLAGARKALAILRQKVSMQPRYRGLVVGIKRNISELEAVLAMPYKDRETYLRKQREFYQRRKARKREIELRVRALSSGVKPSGVLTPYTSRLKNETPKTGTGPPVSRSSAPLPRVNALSFAKAFSTLLTPTPPRAKTETKAAVTSILPPGINKPTAKGRFHVDDCGNARRVINPDEM